MRNFDRVPDYVVQPAVEAGDALFFTEALVHGTMPWTADHERRALLYKYSPGHSSWAIETYNHDDYGDLTDQQKRIMAPPSMDAHPEVVQLVRPASLRTGSANSLTLASQGIYNKGVEFEWDEAKRAANLAKHRHRLRSCRAASAWADALIRAESPRRRDAIRGNRIHWPASPSAGVHHEGQNELRIISLRRAHRKERRSSMSEAKPEPVLELERTGSTRICLAWT